MTQFDCQPSVLPNPNSCVTHLYLLYYTCNKFASSLFSPENSVSPISAINAQFNFVSAFDCCLVYEGESASNCELTGLCFIGVVCAEGEPNGLSRA